MWSEIDVKSGSSIVIGHLLCDLEYQRTLNCLKILSKHGVNNFYQDLLNMSFLESVTVP